MPTYPHPPFPLCFPSLPPPSSLDEKSIRRSLYVNHARVSLLRLNTVAEARLAAAAAATASARQFSRDDLGPQRALLAQPLPTLALDAKPYDDDATYKWAHRHSSGSSSSVSSVLSSGSDSSGTDSHYGSSQPRDDSAGSSAVSSPRRHTHTDKCSSSCSSDRVALTRAAWV